MRDGWRVLPLGDVATLDIDKVPVKSDRPYKLAGVLNRGQGLLDRGVLNGSETSYSVLHRLHADQLVMRKLTAWEGTLAVVPKDFDGYVVSTEFPTFSLDRRAIHPRFMEILCAYPEVWERMRLGVRGTVQRRKRLNPGDLLRVEVALPSLDGQRRIVDLISAVDHAIEAAEGLRQASEQSKRSVLSDFMGKKTESPVGWSEVGVDTLLDLSIGGVWGAEPGLEFKDVRVIRSTEFRNNGHLEPSTAARRSLSSGQLNSRQLMEGDLLLEKSGGGPNQPVGRVARVDSLARIILPALINAS